MKPPFAAATRLPPDLARVRDYWRGLLRGSAKMPFWDDAKLTDLPDLSDRLFLIDVFDQPERFRFAIVGAAASKTPLAGEFLDETRLAWPLEYLRAQSSATVEAAAPTLFRGRPARGETTAPYRRLLLPMWGDGRIGMLMGALDFD